MRIHAPFTVVNSVPGQCHVLCANSFYSVLYRCSFDPFSGLCVGEVDAACHLRDGRDEIAVALRVVVELHQRHGHQLHVLGNVEHAWSVHTMKRNRHRENANTGRGAGQGQGQRMGPGRGRAWAGQGDRPPRPRPRPAQALPQPQPCSSPAPAPALLKPCPSPAQAPALLRGTRTALW